MPRMEITTRIGCINNCDYCPQDILKKAYFGDTTMSLDTFKKCLDKIPRVVTINFSGFCEPWLNKNCTQMILYAHRKGHKIIVYTTLVGMQSKDLDLIRHIPIEIFAVHEIDNTPPRIKEKVERYIQNAVFLKEGHNLEISTRAGNLGKGDSFESKTPRTKGPIACLRSLRCNVLLPNGDVMVCCNDYGLKHKLGNLLEDNYEDLFLGEEYRRLLKGLWDDSEDIICRYCDNFMSKVRPDGKLEKYPEIKVDKSCRYTITSAQPAV